MRIPAALLALAFVVPASADVTSYLVFFSRYYNQITPSPPTTPNSIYASFDLQIESADEAASAYIQKPNAGTIAFERYGDTGFTAGRPYATVDALYADLPPGGYEYVVTGGTLGTASGWLYVPQTPLWPNAIPALSPDTFDLLQSPIDVTQPLTLEFNSWTPSGDATQAYTILYAYVIQTGVSVVRFVEPADSSYQFEADLFPPDQTIALSIMFSARQQDSDAGFGGSAYALVAYDHTTSLTFSTAPASNTCAADFNADGFVDDIDFVLFAQAYDLFDCMDIDMPADCPADLFSDGFVDDTDFVLFAQAYDQFVCR